jgi:hypothetical protein
MGLTSLVGPRVGRGHITSVAASDGVPGRGGHLPEMSLEAAVLPRSTARHFDRHWFMSYKSPNREDDQ